jgi:hypothetical protein
VNHSLFGPMRLRIEPLVQCGLETRPNVNECRPRTARIPGKQVSVWRIGELSRLQTRSVTLGPAERIRERNVWAQR